MPGPVDAVGFLGVRLQEIPDTVADPVEALRELADVSSQVEAVEAQVARLRGAMDMVEAMTRKERR